MKTNENINSENLKKPCPSDFVEIAKYIVTPVYFLPDWNDDWDRVSSNGQFQHFVTEKLTDAKKKIITLSMCKKWCNRVSLAKRKGSYGKIINEFAERLNYIFNNDFLQSLGTLMMPIAILKDEVNDIRALLDDYGKQYVYFDMAQKISMKSLFEQVKQHVDANEIVVLDKVEKVPESPDHDMVYQLIISALRADTFNRRGETIDFGASHVVIAGKNKTVKGDAYSRIMDEAKTVLLRM